MIGVIHPKKKMGNLLAILVGLVGCVLLSSASEAKTYIKCEYEEIIDRVDNDGQFSRLMLPDCFPSNFDMMCKRTGVRFFAIDDESQKMYFAETLTERVISQSGFEVNPRNPHLILVVNEMASSFNAYQFNRITGEFVANEKNPKHTITQMGQCKKISEKPKF